MGYWVKDGDVSRLYGDEEQWVKSNGDQMPGNWPKLAEDGWQEVVLTPEPVVPGQRTTGNRIQMVDGVPTRVWFTEAVAQPTEEEEALALAMKAQVALDKADVTALRCFKAGVAYPPEWKLYSDALRLIATGKDTTSTGLPAQPAYPPGT